MTAVQMLPVSAIRPDPQNPRRKLGDLQELADTLKGPIGLLEPVVVRPNGDGFLLVAGARRHGAAELAGIAELPAIVREMSDDEALEAMLLENLQREDLTPLEEAGAYHQLMEAKGWSQHELAERIGRSQSHVSKRVSLLEVPEVGRDALDSGGITLEEALELRKLADHPHLAAKAIEAKASSGYYRSMGTLVDERLREQKASDRKKAARERAKSEGIKLVGYPTYGGKTRLLGKANVQMAVPFTKAQHKKEPCHAATLSPSWDGSKFVYVCTDIERHNEKGESKLKAPKDASVSHRSISTGPSKAELAKREALKEAAERRTAWLTRLVTEVRGRKISKDEIATVIANAVVGDAYLMDAGHDAMRAMGIKDRAKYCTESPANVQRVAFAMALFAGEFEVVESNGPPAWYTEFLAKHGYEFSDVERKAFGIKASVAS